MIAAQFLKTFWPSVPFTYYLNICNMVLLSSGSVDNFTPYIAKCHIVACQIDFCKVQTAIFSP